MWEHISNLHLSVKVIVIVLLSAVPLSLYADDRPLTNDILYCFSLQKKLHPHFSTAVYSEFTVNSGPLSIGYNYSCLSVSYMPKPWLSFSVAGGYTGEGQSSKWHHKFQSIQKFSFGKFSLAFRESVTHTRDIRSGDNGGVLRFRVNLSYNIAGSRMSPLFNVETYLWDKWRRTSIYVGTRIAVSECLGVNFYYMRSEMPARQMNHLVIAMSFSI